MTLLYVALGGALGSVARYLMQTLIGHYSGASFPYGTLLVNVTGSFLMGLVIGWLGRVMPAHAPELRLFLTVGILGGYTTFSSFSLDAIVLYDDDRWKAMGVYIAASVILSLAGLFAGLRLMRHLA